MAAGAMIGQILIIWISAAGSSASAIGTLLMGLFPGVLISRLPSQELFRLKSASWNELAPQKKSPVQDLLNTGFLLPVILSIVTMLLSWLTPELLTVSLRAGSQMFASSPSSLQSTGTAETLLALFFPAVIIGTLTAAAIVWHSPRIDADWTESSGSLAFGGLGLTMLLLHSEFSYPLAMTVSVLIFCATLLQVLAQGSPGGKVAGNPDTHSKQSGAAAAKSIFVTIASGFTMAAVAETMSMLISDSIPSILLTIFLTTLFVFLASRPLAKRLLSGYMMPSAALVLISSLPWLFSLLTNWNLSLKSSVSIPLVLLSLGAVQAAFFLMAALMPSLTAIESKAIPGYVSGWLLSLGVLAGLMLGLLVSGMADATTRLASGVTLQAFMIAVASLMRLPAGEKSLLSRLRTYSIRERLMAAGTLLLPALCLSLSLTARPNPGNSDQLLFSARSMAAVRLGMERELIPLSDSSRQVAAVSTSQGEVHVWRRSGHIFEFRRNGVSLGQVSADTDLTPQPVQEIMPAILPLVAHPSPNRILLLGDDTGICLRVCSHFPAQRIVAVREDLDVTELARQYTWAQQQPAPDQDERVTVLHEPASVVLQISPEVKFDVMIAASPPASTSTAAWEFTEEFYSLASRQLSDNGIFCQRFSHHDLGPEPLRQVIATAMSKFKNVVAIQTIPGEIVLLAGNTESRFLGEHILTRLQQDYIRDEIAAAGWDWAQVAILPMLDAADPVGMFSHRKPPHAVNIANSRFLMSLPIEVRRWNNRSMELQAEFSPHQLRLAEAIPPGEAHHEIKRRLSLISQQVEILAGMPDEPWTYRNSLRTEMQRNPRPPKEVIRNNEIIRTAHPTDLLHQQYFVTLSKAIRRVQTGDHSYEALVDLASFASHHEPLLSLFAYYELVRLHEMAKHPEPIAEYRHRLHTVFFTESSDASVRPVIAAMQHLMDHPEVVESDAERFDQLNSLIQKLIERWEARTAWEPRSARRVQIDVDQSVMVTNRAIEKLEQWAPTVRMSQSSFLKRRRFIHAALIRPLREYGEQVLAHRMKTESPAASQAANDDSLPLLLDPQDLTN